MINFYNLRTSFILFIVIFASLIIMGRIFYLVEIYPYKIWKYNIFVRESKLKRGQIYTRDKNGNLIPVVTNKKFYRIILSPRLVDEGREEELKKILKDNFGINEEITYKKLAKKDSFYEVLKQRLTEEELEKSKNIRIKGLSLEEYDDRFYHFGESLSQITGFFGFEKDYKTGKYGVEEYYNDQLSSGDDLVLSIEPNLNIFIETLAKKIFNNFKSDKVLITISEVGTGRIIGFASLPSFNPNEYWTTSNFSLFLNPLASESFEPGSVFKIFTWFLGLNYQKIDPQENYLDKGFVAIENKIIKNAHEKVYNMVTLKDAFSKSINTGAVRITQRFSEEEYQRGVEMLGFGEFTNIDMPFELKGSIYNLYGQSQVDKATISFGQGIAVTPIQLLGATELIANGGKIVTPSFVDEIMRNGRTIFKREIKIKKTSFSSQTINKMKELLIDVVENGTARRAKVSGYLIAAKTGTAQIPYKDKKGYSQEAIHSVISFAPVYDPKFLIFIKLDKPKGVSFAESTVVPSLKEIYQFLFSYYGIPPE